VTRVGASPRPVSGDGTAEANAAVSTASGWIVGIDAAHPEAACAVHTHAPSIGDSLLADHSPFERRRLPHASNLQRLWSSPVRRLHRTDPDVFEHAALAAV
jgi:hypothetical protein